MTDRDRNGNENCLRNCECPECKHYEKFFIEVSTRVEMFDDGSGVHDDLEWDENSTMECSQCGYIGLGSTFITNDREGD